MHAKMLAKIRQRLASAKRIGFDKLTMLRRIYLEYPDLEEQDCHIYRKGKDKMRYDFQSCQLLVKATGELSLVAKRQIEPLQYVRQRLGRIMADYFQDFANWEQAEPCSYVDLDLASGQFELAPEKVKMLENFEHTLRKCSQYQEFLDCCSADGL